ncbi:phosphatase PAP2 family protein [Arenibacter sp. 6A1]|uniref:phosphatase PAP2 family protein n=1 Tax=Arenibacter sp. 6A1 TaxID=2720391 RepID=UPI001445FCB6|nr:phosphatase PAP2 family protein [Arenibacter sp. 6A1]NKI28422.1 phosphatase PAP2 family protein [Arenibacter sp. 6A1]
MFEKLLEWDRNSFIFLNNLGIEGYDLFWSSITNFSTWIPLFVLFLVLIFKNYPKKEALSMFITIIGTVILIAIVTGVVKEMIARLRPADNDELKSLIRVLVDPYGFSFFSGHAASSFGITTIVYLFLKEKINWGLIFYIWPLLFVFSRIYVGVHYPLDLIVGAMVGILFAVFSYRLYKGLKYPA